MGINAPLGRTAACCPEQPWDLAIVAWPVCCSMATVCMMRHAAPSLHSPVTSGGAAEGPEAGAFLPEAPDAGD